MPTYTQVEIVGDVAVITIDNPPVNALGPGVLEAIEESVARSVAESRVKAIVLVGAGTTFVAGADINVFTTLTTHEQASERSGVMHAQLRHIEDASKPIVATIHGHALGGGLELAMACHYRVAEKNAKVGQPEVLLGLIPGAGGTQRLPRLCGPIMALEMCTAGQPVAAPSALAAGILDRVIVGDRKHLIDAAVEFARERAGASGPRRTRDLTEKLMDLDAALLACAERRVALEPLTECPAPYAAVNAIEAACLLSFDAGSALERELFADCVLSDASRALVHLFFAEREVAKVPGVPQDTPVHAIRRAAVLGAGATGVAIAMMYADAGIPVILQDADQTAVDRGLQTIRASYQSSVANGKMTPEALEANTALITLTTTFAGFASVDIVTEAVSEDRESKTTAFAEMGRATRPDCLLASSSWTVAIDELARASTRPGSVVGHHFVGNGHTTRVIEIVRGRETSREAIATSLKLSKRLGKVGVVVGNCDGLVANRLLTACLREVYRLQAEGALAPQIDRALARFGLAVGPFALERTPGIDVPRIREEAGTSPVESRAVTDEEIVERTTVAIADEGARVIAEGCASRPGDLDIIYCYAFGFPRARGGPMYFIDKQRRASRDSGRT